MSLKNINNLLFLLTLLLFSCKPIGVLKEKKSIYYEYDEVKENLHYIELNPISSLNVNSVDYYSVSNSLKYIPNTNINKLHTFNLNKNNKLDFPPPITIIKNEKLYSLNTESNFNIYDLNNFELLQSLNIIRKLANDYSFPTSFALLNDYFYASYTDGKIICFDFNGVLIWEKDYVDIIKSPIKIHNNNIIVLLSETIISLNSQTGELNWAHSYYSENILQSTGGDIVNLNHLLFFILPNNRVGEIDTLFGEKNISIFSDLILEDSINNSFDKIHVYKNYVSYFDQKKYLTTINFNTNTVILNKNIIENVQSYKLFNNSLITLNSDGLLKSFNILNGNLFWKIDTKDTLLTEDMIINVTNSATSLFIFFQSGSILELSHITGDILSINKLELKNVNSIYFFDKYILINQQNGKTSIFTQ